MRIDLFEILPGNNLLGEATGTLVSKQTVRICLYEANLRARMRAACTLLLKNITQHEEYELKYI